MGADQVLLLAITALQNSASLMDIYQKSRAENRDLNPEELATVQALAKSAHDQFGAHLAAGG